MGKNSCFVASPGSPDELIGGLAQVIDAASAKSSTYNFHLWKDNDIVGRAPVQPIYENIDSSDFVVADITYLNLNVTYEVGYAIGRSKRAILTRHTEFAGDIDLADDIGI